MDVLSEVLRAICLRGSVYFRCCFGRGWGMQVLNAIEQVFFDIVEQGECWLEWPDDCDPVRLEADDCIILPRMTEHTIIDRPGRDSLPAPEVVRRIEAGEAPFPVGSSAPGEGVDILCGYFTFDARQPHPVMASLPDLIHLKSERRPSGWLDQVATVLRYEATETQAEKRITGQRRRWLARL